MIVVAPNNELLEKLKSNIEEVRARGGELYVFADGEAGFNGSDNMHIIEMPHVEETIALSSIRFRCSCWLITSR